MRPRLWIAVLIATAAFLSAGRDAQADYINYYASVRCNPGDQHVSIRLGVLKSREFTLDWHGQIRVAADRESPQNFNVSRAIDYGECHFGPDQLARIRVTEGTVMPYGMCGGDSEVWLSVWIDQRRWVSRLQITGRCSNMAMSHMEIRPSGITICWLPSDPWGFHDRPQNIEMCEFMAPSTFPMEKDTTQFPAKKAPQPGAIVIEHSVDKQLCRRMVAQVTSEFDPEKGQVMLPDEVRLLTSNDIQHGLYDGSGHFSRSTFDMDNSGNVRTVYGFHPSNHGNDADVYFVTPGAAIDGVWPRISADMLFQGSPYILPHSFGQCDGHACQPTDEYEERSIAFQNYEESGKPLEFSSRYLHQTPFAWRNETYFLLQSLEARKRAFAVVVKPAPDHFEEICIFRRVPLD